MLHHEQVSFFHIKSYQKIKSQFPFLGWEVQLHLGDSALHPGPWSKHSRRVPSVRCTKDVKRYHPIYLSLSLLYLPTQPFLASHISFSGAYQHFGWFGWKDEHTRSVNGGFTSYFKDKLSKVLEVAQIFTWIHFCKYGTGFYRAKMGRKFFVGGNWKMNGTKADIDAICAWLTSGPLDTNCEVRLSEFEE